MIAMKKITLLVLVSLLAYITVAQNGFDSTEIDFPSPDVYGYTIDNDGNYWFADFNKLIKYDGVSVSQINPGGNQNSDRYFDLWSTDTKIFLAGSGNIYAFNPDTPGNLD